MNERARSKSKDGYATQRPISAMQNIKPRPLKYRPTTAVVDEPPEIKFNTISNDESVK